MVAEISLSNTPRRQAHISVGTGENKLTWTFDAPGISDTAWQELLAHGFAPDIDDMRLSGESREARDFRDRISTVVATLNGAVALLERDHAYEGHEERFLDYAAKIIQQERESGESPSRVDKYRVAISKFRQYLRLVNKEEILFRNLNAEIIEGFDKSLANEGLRESTRAFYNRILVAIYNRGVKQGISADNSPFANVATQYRQVTTDQHHLPRVSRSPRRPRNSAI